MNIVIIGEYSSFSKNLSEGFRALGHESFVFSWGDGFKDIKQNPQDSYIIKLKYKGKGLFWHLVYIIQSFWEFVKLKNYVSHSITRRKWDVVLIINPSFIKRRGFLYFWHSLFTDKMVKSMVRNTENIYMSACGNDIPFYDYWKDHPWKNRHFVDCGIKRNYTDEMKAHFEYCMSFVNKAIPVMYMYAEAWRNSSYTKDCKVFPTIPLPVITSKYHVKNDLKNKIVIFHGIIRPDEKGTPIIVEAMNRLQEKYPNDVECVAKGGMPLDDYLLLLNRTNILIDQAHSDSVGMNGLYALAMGKVVLSGNTHENQKEFGEYDCPIVNIMPDPEQIFMELEKLVLNRDKIKELSMKSREYVVRVHDAETIAQRYIDVFQDTFTL